VNGSPAILVNSLRKRYGDFEAVRGIDFHVNSGEVFGMLGPNGAGKTTTVEILEGLRERTSGEVQVLGMDPIRQVHQLKDRIGVCLQATNLPDKIQVCEAIELFGALYSQRVDGNALLTRLQLTEKRRSYYSQLSGGQKQRLAITLAMINDPHLVFLDEPTTGLDPQARLEIHKLIEELRAERRTILLTTHYIEEAERLCDRVAIIDEGCIIAMGTPREIQSRTLGNARIEIDCVSPLPAGALVLPSVCQLNGLSSDRRTVTVVTPNPGRAVVEMVKWIDQQGNELADIHIRRPTLEDVFIELTGKRLRE
jgi:ABC-2 type transport system ATP-binding protein